jgi:K+-transporting ATPase KdpF subunit
MCAASVSGGAIMTTFYLIGAVLAGLLLIYLFVAMLKPEWF